MWQPVTSKKYSNTKPGSVAAKTAPNFTIYISRKKRNELDVKHINKKTETKDTIIKAGKIHHYLPAADFPSPSLEVLLLNPNDRLEPLHIVEQMYDIYVADKIGKIYVHGLQN